MGRSRALGPGGSGLPGSDEDPHAFASRSKRRRLPSVGAFHDGSATDGKKALYHCNYCQKDITGTVRIKCAKCPDFDLCVECFSVGVEIHPHKCNHPYRVMDSLSFPLLHPDWNADEEILLLEAVEMYGLSNWSEVADHVGTRRKDQCKEHFMTIYMNSPCAPLPDMSGSVGKTKAELTAMGKEAADKKRALQAETSGGAKVESPVTQVKSEVVKEEDMPTTSGGGKSLDATQLTGGRDGPSPAPSEATGASAEHDRHVGRKSLGGAHAQQGGEGSHPVAGAKKSAAAAAAAAAAVAHPREGGVAVVPSGGTKPGEGGGEKGNEAGDIVHQSNRSIGSVKKPKGSGVEEAKAGASAAELAGYNPKRDEFDPEYDNDAELPLAEMDFKDTDQESEARLKVKMLHIYYARLEERYRRKHFILERNLLCAKRQQPKTKEERELSQRLRVFARYHSPEEHEALLTGLCVERRIRQRIAELQEYRQVGCHTLAEGEVYDSERRRREREREANLRKAKDSTSYLYSSKAANLRAARYSSRDRSELGEAAADAGAGNRKMKAGAMLGMPPISSAVMNTVGSRAAKKAGTTLDLAGHAGTELLSAKEQELCSQYRLLPVHFLRMKEKLMMESDVRGGISLMDAYQLFKVDPLKTERVYSHLLSNGWITGAALSRNPSKRMKVEPEEGRGGVGESVRATGGGSPGLFLKGPSRPAGDVEGGHGDGSAIEKDIARLMDLDQVPMP